MEPSAFTKEVPLNLLCVNMLQIVLNIYYNRRMLNKLF